MARSRGYILLILCYVVEVFSSQFFGFFSEKKVRRERMF